MWFIWDGRARTGPYSELEICRRVASGQWPLTLFVRPENSSVFRPLIWMLPEWTEDKNSTESTIVRELMPMHEATQIASPLLFDIGRREMPAHPEIPVANPEIPIAVPQKQKTVPEVQHFAPQLQNEKVERQEASGDFDFLTTDLAGPRDSRRGVSSEKLASEHIQSGELINIAPFSLTPSSPVSLQPTMKGEFSNKTANSVIRAASAAIEEGERQTREFENRKLTALREKNNDNLDQQKSGEKLEVGAGSVGGRAAVQSPAKASEGSVSLVDQSSATQIKFRRVNPTAPRRRSKGSGSKFKQKFGIFQLGRFLTKQSGASNQPWNVSSIAVSFSVLVLLVGIGGYVYYKKKHANNEVPTFEVQEQSTSVNEPIMAPKRKKKPKVDAENPAIEGRQIAAGVPPTNPTIAPEVQKKPNESPVRKKSTLKALPLPKNEIPSPKLTAPTFKSDMYATGVDLRKYLSKAGPKGFIVVGPITLQERPSKQCAPCLGSGLLPDGTSVNLSSFAAAPWKKVARKNVVYVRGFLSANGNLTLMINSIDDKPL
ncbi:hypothetical protein EBR21_01630 [bacterium]|nr:hypothetical protein [bacterium]